MKLSNDGRKLIQRFEGCSLKAYPDGEHFSIGWGHNGPDVEEGMKITRTQAQKLFSKDIEAREKAVMSMVKVPLKQHEFDALVSLVYNIGAHAFSRSNLLIHLNRDERSMAANQFLRWNRFEKEVNAGLVKRRAAERSLFTGHDIETAFKTGEEAHAAYNERLQGT